MLKIRFWLLVILTVCVLGFISRFDVVLRRGKTRDQDRSVLLCRNMCLSLEPRCSRESLLLLWEHECWTVYGGRMINEIDSGRFRQMFVRAVHKNYDNAADVRIVHHFICFSCLNINTVLQC